MISDTDYCIKRVSVITVNLNNALGLRKTIVSVLEQSYSDYEYIIVDGESRDGSIEVIKEFESKISGWVSASDKGIYDAMNRGVAISKGDWIIFMNSGDVFSQADVLKSIFLTEIADKYDIVFGNTLVNNYDRRIIPKSVIRKSFFLFDTICHQSVFYRKTLFKKFGNFNLRYKILADREHLLRLIKNNCRFLYVNIDICIWESSGYSIKNIEQFKSEEKEVIARYFTVPEKLFYRLERKFTSLFERVLNYFK